MTRDGVDALIGLLAAAYPRQDLPPASITLYRHMLADLDARAAGEAVMDWISREKWWPSVGEVRRAVFDRTSGLPDPERAWEIVTQATRTQPTYEPGYEAYVMPAEWPQHLRDVVSTIGWRRICLGESASVDRAQFLRAYAASVERQFRRWTEERLPGLMAADKGLRPALAGGKQRERVAG